MRAVATNKSQRRSQARRAGLSLVEALISLVITAMLLTAAGAAFQGAAKAVEINDQFFRATQAARVSMNRIASDVRNSLHCVVQNNTITLTSATGEVHTYRFNTADQTLQVTLSNGATSTVTTMAHNVESASFSSSGESLSATLTVKVGDNKILLNGSAMPRRLVTYQ